MINKEKTLGIKQAAYKRGVCEITIWTHIQKGLLKAVKEKNIWVIKEEDFDEYLKALEKNPIRTGPRPNYYNINQD